ncbi:MAG: hypothetical protein AAF561_11790 [Planctomycetota bacterium]
MPRLHKPSIIAIAVLAVVSMVGGFAYQELKHRTAVKQVDLATTSFVGALETGFVEEASRVLGSRESERNEVLPMLTLLSGQLALDRALNSQFGEGLRDRPLPVSHADQAESIVFEDDVAFIGEDANRLVFVRDERGAFRIDRRPFVSPGIKLEAAQAMRAELVTLANRVRDGEFDSRDAALDAYQTAAFRGLLAGIAATSRPAEVEQ